MNTNFLVDGRPTLTVMIQARTPERVFELIEKGLDGGADAFGLQLEQLEHKYRTEDKFKSFFKAMNGKPAYVTNYRTNLNTNMTDEERAAELLKAAGCGAALIDVMGDLYCPSELEIAYDENAAERQRELIGKIHATGAEVLMSSHTAKFLAPETVLKIAETQVSRGADIAKVVTVADSEKELDSNYTASLLLKEKLGHPFLFLSVGKCCAKHRRIAPFLTNGIFLCVVCQDELSTPAQPLLKTAKEMVSLF